MSEVLTWYSSGSSWKSLNLAARNLALKTWYISHLRDTWVIQGGDKILELWCGQWHKLQTMIQSFRDATFKWLELYPEMIEKAKERIPNTEIIQWDMMQAEDIPDEIDVACYFQSLHHLDLEGRTQAAEVIHSKLNDKGRVLIIESLKPEVQSAFFDSVNRAYAVLSQYPWNKTEQFYHSVKSFINPWEYNPEDYGYFSPQRENILWGSQSALFELKHQITPFWWLAISDILIFEKK